MVLVCGVTMVNLILLAENRLLLPTEDRSTALRIGFFAQFLLIIGMAVYPALTLPSYPVYSVCKAPGRLGGLHLAAVALFFRYRRAGPVASNSSAEPYRRDGVDTLAIFRPGGTWGPIYVLTQMALFLVVGAIFLDTNTANYTWLVAICAYICFFTGLPAWAGRMMAKRHFKPFHLRAGVPPAGSCHGAVAATFWCTWPPATMAVCIRVGTFSILFAR
jgi:hypothetical protein